MAEQQRGEHYSMALQNISQRWTIPIRDWGSALNQFAILYGDRVPL